VCVCKALIKCLGSENSILDDVTFNKCSGTRSPF